METPQLPNPEPLKLNKVRGDLQGDIALLDQLLPYINGRLKYSVECPPTYEFFLSFTAYPADLIDVQTEMRVEILIDFQLNHHLLVYFHPLDMLRARVDPDLTALEISHASRLVQYHLWVVERDLYYGRSYPNLKRSMGNYLLGCCPAFVAWNQSLGVAGAGQLDVVASPDAAHVAGVTNGGVQRRGGKQVVVLESEEEEEESFEDSEEESFEEEEDSEEDNPDSGAIEENDAEEYLEKGRRKSTRRK